LAVPQKNEARKPGFVGDTIASHNRLPKVDPAGGKVTGGDEAQCDVAHYGGVFSPAAAWVFAKIVRVGLFAPEAHAWLSHAQG
jgi:hypothetical protein